MLIQGGKVFVAPPGEVKSYADIIDFALAGYQEKTNLFFPVMRRIGLFGYFATSFLRGLVELFHSETDIKNSKSEEEARQRLSNQISNQKYVNEANVVFCSKWEVAYTRKQVDKAWNHLLHTYIKEQ